MNKNIKKKYPDNISNLKNFKILMIWFPSYLNKYLYINI